jgi:hypothetical protein
VTSAAKQDRGGLANNYTGRSACVRCDGGVAEQAVTITTSLHCRFVLAEPRGCRVIDPRLAGLILLFDSRVRTRKRAYELLPPPAGAQMQKSSRLADGRRQL